MDMDTQHGTRLTAGRHRAGREGLTSPIRRPEPGRRRKAIKLRRSAMRRAVLTATMAALLASAFVTSIVAITWADLTMLEGALLAVIAFVLGVITVAAIVWTKEAVDTVTRLAPPPRQAVIDDEEGSSDEPNDDQGPDRPGAGLPDGVRAGSGDAERERGADNSDVEQLPAD